MMASLDMEMLLRRVTNPELWKSSEVSSNKSAYDIKMARPF